MKHLSAILCLCILSACSKTEIKNSVSGALKRTCELHSENCTCVDCDTTPQRDTRMP